MRKPNYSCSGNCRQCGKYKYISARGLCKKCGQANSQIVVDQMIQRKGPVFEKWQAGMLRNADKISNDMRLAQERKQQLELARQQMQEQQ